MGGFGQDIGEREDSKGFLQMSVTLPYRRQPSLPSCGLGASFKVHERHLFWPNDVSLMFSFKIILLLPFPWVGSKQTNKQITHTTLYFEIHTVYSFKS